MNSRPWYLTLFVVLGYVFGAIYVGLMLFSIGSSLYVQWRVNAHMELAGMSEDLLSQGPLYGIYALYLLAGIYLLVSARAIARRAPYAHEMLFTAWFAYPALDLLARWYQGRSLSPLMIALHLLWFVAVACILRSQRTKSYYGAARTTPFIFTRGTVFATSFVMSLLAYRHAMQNETTQYLAHADAKQSKRFAELRERIKGVTDKEERFGEVNDLAVELLERGELDEAATYAREALELAARFPDQWNTGNAIYDGHQVLGLIALKRGDVETAKREVVLASRNPGSPQLDTFGPDLKLERALLQRGEKESVVEALQNHARYWEGREDDLSRWRREIETTGTTDFTEQPSFLSLFSDDL